LTGTLHSDRARELIEAEIHRREAIGESDKNFELRETRRAILYRIFRKGCEANGVAGPSSNTVHLEGGY
jgi:hypothetical protein